MNIVKIWEGGVIKRYDLAVHAQEHSLMVRAALGDFILYNDHATLIAKVREIAEGMECADDCASLHCAVCGNVRSLTTNHYFGPLDSHNFTEQECTCPRGKLLALCEAASMADWLLKQWEERGKEIAALRAQLEQAQAERDEARRNYQWMVGRAADEKLDGYRELGARAANAENALDEAREELDAGRLMRNSLLEEIERQKATIARQRAWIESAGHRPGCAVNKCKAFPGCSGEQYSPVHSTRHFAFEHVFIPSPCDCGWAELVGGRDERH